MSVPAIQTHKLTKQYRRVTALHDCSVTVPAGRICALVGPNGAGKTTFLRILAGLARSSGGSVAVLGAAPRQDPAFLAGIGYLAQEMPLYRRLDKQPRVLLLDEPVAALDPLARRHFLSTLTSAVADADGGLTVMLSSHLVSDLERVCDYLILLSRSRVQLCGDIDELLGVHKVLVAPRKDTSAVEKAHTVVRVQRTARQVALLARLRGPVLDPAYRAEDVSLEELVLGYMGAGTEPARAYLATAGEDQ